MDTLKLLITDNTFIITEGGKMLLEKTFVSDDECMTLLSAFFSNRKSTNVTCLLSGSRIVGETQSIQYNHKEAFMVDEKLIAELTRNAEHTLIEKYADVAREVVQSTCMETRLNGYKVTHIKKQKVNDLALFVFIAALSSSYKKRLIAALGKTKSFTIESFVWYQAKRVKHISKKDDFIICSVYENSTDLSIRKGDSFFKTITIALGAHHITDPSFPLWFDDEVKKALTSMSDGMVLPGTVYLQVAPAFEKIFDTAFRSEAYHSMCLSEKGFEVTNMSSILIS